MLSANFAEAIRGKQSDKLWKIGFFCPRSQVLRSAFLRHQELAVLCRDKIQKCVSRSWLQESKSSSWNYRFSFRKVQIFVSQSTDFRFSKYRFSFRKVQIFISQSTDFHFAKYRFSFRKVQIFISQSTDFRFAKYRFSFRKVQISFRKVQIFISQSTDFISFRFVSQSTIRINKPM